MKYYLTAFILSISLFISNPVWAGRRPPPQQEQQPVQVDASPDQRSVKYRKYLSASVKIQVSWASGSGTIVYYDRKTGEAYVITCGHLWKGTKDNKDIPDNVNVSVITWYKNDQKLEKPVSYKAQILFWSNDRGFDTALLKFKPDWEPNYFALADADLELVKGNYYNSTGCEGGREVAHYYVKYSYFGNNTDIITDENSPRPGRSGGGLLSDDGWLVATCWGYGIQQNGLFTPISHIYSVFKRNGYDWLFSMPRFALARYIENGEAIPMPKKDYTSLPR